MAGAVTRNGPMETFIERQIAVLRANSIEIAHLPIIRSRHVIQERLREWWRARCPLVLLRRKLREAFGTADLLHFQWPAHLIQWFPLARRFGKPIILSLRGRQINIVPHMPGEEAYTCRLRRILPLCDAYHCVSADIRRAGEEFGLVPSRAWVIRPAVDTSFFTPGAPLASSTQIKVAMVGGLIWRKGFEYALMALSKVIQAGLDIRLTIVGDGPEEDRILRTAEDLGIRSRVALAGRKPPTEVRRILQEQDFFLHASLSEGIANVVLEAMACGLPVVSTDAGGMEEAIVDGEEGYLVPLRDAETMAERIAKLAACPKLRREMGQKARVRTVREFDLQDQGRQFVQLYQAVLSRS
jgi:colanic acid/amylovoran biosynthesis glycosyltransferase